MMQRHAYLYSLGTNATLYRINNHLILARYKRSSNQAPIPRDLKKDKRKCDSRDVHSSFNQ